MGDPLLGPNPGAPGFAPYMQLHRASERGYLSFPQVEDAVAGYLSPASPTMRLGQKPLLPTRVARHQVQLAEKAYLAAGQAACTTNTAALLQRYQAKLLTELALSLGEDHPSVAQTNSVHGTGTGEGDGCRGGYPEVSVAITG